jgi:competence protein ComEC
MRGLILAIGAVIGLTQPALLLVELGCRWILLVADLVAGMDGAAWGVVTPPGATLPVLTFGGLLVILWRGRLRWAGLPLMALALWLWTGAERPDLLIAPSGGVVGMATETGRAVSRATGDGFVVETWLENDGDTATQEEAAARPGLIRGEREARAELGAGTVLLVRGKRALAALEGCGGARVLVTDQEGGGERPCLVLDAAVLRRTGPWRLGSRAAGCGSWPPRPRRGTGPGPGRGGRVRRPGWSPSAGGAGDLAMDRGEGPECA